MPVSAPQVGSLAPEFTLECTAGEGSHVTKSLAGYRGRWLILLFYPRDFSLVCPTELTALSARFPELRKKGCDVLAVSTDSLETHDRWIATPRSQSGLGPLNYPLGADPEGTMCEAFGVYLPMQRAALRGLFIIDANQVLQYAVVHNTSVGRRTDEVLRVLEALQSGGLCPENWQPGMSPLPPGDTIGPGTVLGHYEFLEKLGRGAFATVFKARDQQLDRIVAIKVLDPSRVRTPTGILDEARTVAALNHPNVCGVHAIDDTEGVSMIVLEYIEGKPLRGLMQSGPLPVPRTAGVAMQIARGMAAAHAHGIVHGDLKPENILVRKDGVVKITDFGLARREPQRSSPDSTLVLPEQREERIWGGTPRYMSPEQAEGRPATRASDVFSLGLIVYEMATGKAAFDGEILPALLLQVLKSRPEDFVASAPRELSGLLGPLLSKDPAARPTMADAAEQLGHLVT